MGDMRPSKTLAGAEAAVALALEPLSKKPLSEVVRLVLEFDPNFENRRSEREVFAEAYGRSSQGEEAYKRSCIFPEDSVVREFCIARLHKIVLAFVKTVPPIPQDELSRRIMEFLHLTPAA